MTLASYIPEPPEADFTNLPKALERTMPENVEAEQHLLGSFLLDGDSFNTVTTQPEEFYLEKHRWIFEAMFKLASAGTPIDFITLCARLQEDRKLEAVGGAPYLAQLIGAIPTSRNATAYADLVRREWTKRGLIKASVEIAELAFSSPDVPTEGLVPLAYSKLLALPQPRTQGTQSFNALMDVWYPDLRRYREEKREVWGLETGFDFDPFIGGLQKTELMLVTGYAGIGKTSMGLQIGVELAKRNNAAIIFSLEMSARSLALRLVTEQASVDSDVIRRGKETFEQMEMVDNFIARHRDIPLFINDHDQTEASIRMEIARLKALGIDITTAIIDYTRLVRSKIENEAQRIVHILQSFKQLAKSEDVAVIALHALNRDLTKKTKDADGRMAPTLGSLAYGGEYDADVVACVDYDMNRTDLLAYFYLLKNRNGKLGRVTMTYNPVFTKWSNLDRDTQERLARERAERQSGMVAGSAHAAPVPAEQPEFWQTSQLE